MQAPRLINREDAKHFPPPRAFFLLHIFLPRANARWEVARAQRSAGGGDARGAPSTACGGGGKMGAYRFTTEMTEKSPARVARHSFCSVTSV